VFAERVARDIAQADPLRSLPRVGKWTVPLLEDRGAAQVAADTTRDVMWRDAGVVRTAAGLRSARDRLRHIEKRLPVGATEELNLVQTAQLIVEGAIRRKESRGGHYRSDYPRAKGAWRGKHIEL
jgi:L-aspartate oxidase